MHAVAHHFNAVLDRGALLIMKTRGQLIELYGDRRTEEGKLKSTHVERRIAVHELRAKKKAIIETMLDTKSSYGHNVDDVYRSASK